MGALRLGVVSNVWGALLPQSSLTEQCAWAAEAGYAYVELRQRALAECEEAVAGDDRPWPKVSALAALAAAYPALGFNLAVEVPFLTEPLHRADAYLLRCAEAAAAVSGEDPVLRLVDVSPAPTLLDHEEAIDELGHALEGIAREVWRSFRVRLALENSKQPLLSLRAVIRRAAFSLPDSVPVPQLCWDPQNQLSQQLLPENPGETAATLPVEELFEFHFKQCQEGVLLNDVVSGDLDWSAIIPALVARGFSGPALFEIPPGPDIRERLQRSTHYLSPWL